jgi:DNA replication protein DnaC
MRPLATVEMLIIDDLALQPLDPVSTDDFYELYVNATYTARILD